MYLKVKDLLKEYQLGDNLIKNLSFSLKRGDIMSFFGESGVGKSTFLRCLSGLENINSGIIELNNLILNSNKTFVPPQNRNISFVFQDNPLFPHLNLKENILFNLNPLFHSKLDEILSLTSLTKLLQRYPHQLSGGEQQRGCIARALIREPDLLLLDEPFSNLDLSIKNVIRNEIKHIIKSTNTTTILVTHDINDSLSISDKLLVFRSGKVQQFDNPEIVYNNPRNIYCAQTIGEINKIFKNKRSAYIRPEKIKIVQCSDYKFIVSSCTFMGRYYKINGFVNDESESWTIYNSNSINVGEIIFLQFEKNDILYLS